MIALIVNPISGKGKALKRLPEIAEYLKRNNESFDVFISQYKGEALKIAKEIVEARKYDKVIVAGGDGTINEVSQHLVGTDIPLLPLPLGTGNDFVKYIYPFQKFDTILEKRLSSNKVLEVDVGVVESQGFKRFFVNGMGIGFDSVVLNNMKKIKLLKGDFLYTSAVLWTFITYKGMDLIVSIEEGGNSFSGKFLLFNVGNGQYLGGGFRLFPKASLKDGLLDVSIIGPLRPMRFFTNFYKAFKGKHIYLPEVTYFKTDKLKISSDKTFSFQLDGELFTDFNEIKVFSKNQALKVII